MMKGCVEAGAQAMEAVQRLRGATRRCWEARGGHVGASGAGTGAYMIDTYPAYPEWRLIQTVSTVSCRHTGIQYVLYLNVSGVEADTECIYCIIQ